MRQDVVVLGAGLAGLTAARQLARADGRLVQLGGEVVAPFHTAYHELVDELGLTIVPAFPSLPGEETFVLADRERLVGDGFPFFEDDDRRSYEQVEKAFAGWLTKWIPTTPGRTRAPASSIPCRSRAGCARRAPRPQWCGRASWSPTRSRLHGAHRHG